MTPQLPRRLLRLLGLQVRWSVPQQRLLLLLLLLLLLRGRQCRACACKRLLLGVLGLRARRAAASPSSSRSPGRVVPGPLLQECLGHCQPQQLVQG